MIKRLAHRLGVRRHHVAAARLCCERHVLTVTGPRSGERSRILCYHTVDQPAWGVNDVSAARFRAQLEYLRTNGYRVVRAADLADGQGGPRDVAITFDDGLRSVLTTAAPILAEYGWPWTFFPVVDWTEHGPGTPDAEILGWADIEQLVARGAEVGSHSMSHPDFGRISPDQAADELGRSGDILRSRLGQPVDSFAIPLGQSSNWPSGSDDLASAAGYRIVYAQSESNRPGSTVPRTFITRFDSPRLFRAALTGRFDRWEEWV